jgi:hypothetical protein
VKTQYTITDHAVKRLRQRFGHVKEPIEQLLDSSIVFGGQYGSDYLLLNEQYQIVFPVTTETDAAEHFVRTVLTLPQAQANLSRFSGVNFKTNTEELRKRCDALREKAKAEADAARAAGPPPPAPRRPNLVDEQPADPKQIAACKKHAEEFVARTGGWHFPDMKEIKQLYKELKEKIAITKKQFEDVCLPEVGRLIRVKRQERGVKI